MADWGVMTWDGSGNKNNTGILPTFILGYSQISKGQASGSFSYALPSGMGASFIFIPFGSDDGSSWRTITISGETVTLSSSSSGSGANTYPIAAGLIVVYAVNL